MLALLSLLFSVFTMCVESIRFPSRNPIPVEKGPSAYGGAVIVNQRAYQIQISITGQI